jgi:hypothetical protein
LSSITDLPILKSTDDLLDLQDYGESLSEFITESDTPITIGLQGEWGTGKTSLMALLNERLSSRDIATSWVNTWEYSMFRGSQEITPSVLKGMLKKLEENCKEAGFWDLGDEMSQKAKQVAGLLGSIANQVVAKKTGVNISAVASGSNTDHTEVEVSALKRDISAIINKLISNPKNPYQKVVFFVDDLDRIQPSDAVEVLEALKNIFDIPQCVFVLAIDYEVVVKGLEYKFGTKTTENEREFRSFFDKIIQVPFSMPTGAYKMDRFIKEKLFSLGVDLPEDDVQKYSRTVKHTIGSNPRSLKRYLNSFSLINKVRSKRSGLENADDDLMLFMLIGIQISFPAIFRMLVKSSSQGLTFTSWDSGDLKRQGMDWEQVCVQIEQFGENEFLDESWEKVVWGLSQKDAYLRARALDVLVLLNDMRSYFGSDLQSTLTKALEFAAITNVDDSIESKHNSTTKRSFTSEEKLKILDEYEAAPRGKGKLVLEKYSLYPAQISTWRREKLSGKFS